MKIGELKKLLEAFADDEEILVANYESEDSDGNMPLHEVAGAEYIPTTKKQKSVPVIFYYD
jgi:hypothetical protein